MNNYIQILYEKIWKLIAIFIPISWNHFLLYFSFIQTPFHSENPLNNIRTHLKQMTMEERKKNGIIAFSCFTLLHFTKENICSRHYHTDIIQPREWYTTCRQIVYRQRFALSQVTNNISSRPCSCPPGVTVCSLDQINSLIGNIGMYSWYFLLGQEEFAKNIEFTDLNWLIDRLESSFILFCVFR